MEGHTTSTNENEKKKKKKKKKKKGNKERDSAFEAAYKLNWRSEFFS
jgi:hypothetical protein